MTKQPRHEPGPDFNRKVAEALGWEALGGWVYRNGELYRKGWSPSADDRTACKDIEEELLRRGFAVDTRQLPTGYTYVDILSEIVDHSK